MTTDRFKIALVDPSLFMVPCGAALHGLEHGVSIYGEARSSSATRRLNRPVCDLSLAELQQLG